MRPGRDLRRWFVGVSGTLGLVRLAVLPGALLGGAALAVAVLSEPGPGNDAAGFFRGIGSPPPGLLAQLQPESAWPLPSAFFGNRGSGSVPLSERVEKAAQVERVEVAGFIARLYRVELEAAREFVQIAYRAADEFQVDPLLVLAVMSVESSFNPLAQSRRGAQGLMQVRTLVHAERFLPFGGSAAAFDPVANIQVGVSILKEYLDREGSVEGALKSYVGAARLAHDRGYGAKVMQQRDRLAEVAIESRALVRADQGEI